MIEEAGWEKVVVGDMKLVTSMKRRFRRFFYEESIISEIGNGEIQISDVNKYFEVLLNRF